MQVKALRMLNVFALAAAVMLWGGCLLTSSDAWGGGGLELNPTVHFAAAYGLTLLAFAACPSVRRGDLGKLAFLGGALLCVMRAAVSRENMIPVVVAEGLGVAAAVLPSSLERVRAGLRAEGDSRFTLRRSHERRTASRRRQGPVFAPGGMVRS